MVTNVAASVIERLKNIARANQKTFNNISILYFQERFLHRLSLSTYKENFVLKGGLFLYSKTKFKSRPTRDMDFSGRRLSNDAAILTNIIADICQLQPEEDDGVIYQVDQIESRVITAAADYEGVKIIIPCNLGNMRERLELDIGFGDVIVPDAQTIDFPVLLPDMESPEILGYTDESVIAEKFEAMIDLSVANSRMKDFYDIYILASSYSFEGIRLYEAISETFKRRTTNIKRDEVVFTSDFVTDRERNSMWTRYITRLKPDYSPSFAEVMAVIGTFLKPIYEHILDEEEFFGDWDHQSLSWTSGERTNLVG